MPPPDSQLPSDIGSILAGTEATDSDQIVSLKDELETTQSALEKAHQKIELLEREAINLRDNTEIKKSAFAYAKSFMWIIPAFCLILLIVSVTKGISFPFGDDVKSFTWDVNVGAYAQAAFVVGPIVFIATVLGFLLKGVFQQSSNGDDPGLAQLGQSITRSE